MRGHFIQYFKKSRASIKPINHSINRKLSLSTINKSSSLDSSPSTNEVNVVKSTHPPIANVDGLTVPEIIWSNLHLKENRTAIVCSVTGQKLSYGQMYKNSRSFAAALKQNGLKRNDVAAIILPNCINYPSILFGVLTAGGTASTVNPSYTPDELVYQLKLSEAKFAIASTEVAQVLIKSKNKLPHLNSIIVIGKSVEGCHNFSEMLKVNSQGVEFVTGSQINTRESLAFLPFSSGTTGAPKGVMLTHHNVVSNNLQYTAPNVGMIKSINHGEQDKLIGILPFFHSYGLTLLLVTCMYTGNQLLCIPKFNTDTFVSSIREYKPNVMPLVPPIISFLTNHPKVSSEDFKSVEVIQTAAAPLGEALKEKVFEKAQKDFFLQNMYGLTETSPAAIVLDPKFRNSKGNSCGNLIPDTVGKIVDISSGCNLGPNQTGELLLRGPQIMKGYFKNDEATNNCIDSEGWLKTGDIGYYDEDGCFFIVDRIKELIKVKGLQVAPAELEDILRSHSGILDVAVIGIPDEMCGELPRAYIVRKNSEVTNEAVNAFLEGKISKHKELKGGIAFIEAVPKSVSGKILRRELKELYLKSLKS